MKFIPVPDIDVDFVSLRALLLLGIINGFSLQKKVCFCDTKTLAQRLKVSARQVTRLLSELEEKRLISPVYGAENQLIGWQATAENALVSAASDDANCVTDVTYPQPVDNSVDNYNNPLKLQEESRVGTEHALYKYNNILPKGIPLGNSLKGITLKNIRSSIRKKNILVNNIPNCKTPFSFFGGSMKIEIEGQFADHVKRNLQEAGDFERNSAFIMAGRRPMIRWPDLWLSPQELHSVFEYLDENLTDTRWSKVFDAAQAEAVTQKLKGKDTSKLNAYRYLTTFVPQAALEGAIKSRVNRESIRRMK